MRLKHLFENDLASVRLSKYVMDTDVNDVTVSNDVTIDREMSFSNVLGQDVTEYLPSNQ